MWQIIWGDIKQLWLTSQAESRAAQIDKLMRSVLGMILLLAVVTLGCNKTKNTDWSGRIICKENYPLLTFFSHGWSPVNILIVDGKRFKHVRGLNKFYLKVPNTNAIVFVEDKKNYSIVYHIFNMDTDADVAIPAGASVFGDTIGSANPRDTVEIGGDGSIILCNYDQGVNIELPKIGPVDSIKYLCVLDINKKAIVSEKILYYDKTGKLLYERSGGL